MSTISTENDLPTPQSADLSGFSFQLDNNKPVQGPVGPHLFRSSVDSSDFKTSLEVDFVLEKSPVAQNFDLSPAKSQPEVDFYRHASPLPGAQLASLTQAVSQLDVGEVWYWSPQQVANWMRRAGFEESVVEKLLVNDITGAILLELQFEDLKELDIRSFGKRHRLMNSIQHLRNSVMVPTPQPQGDNSPICTAPTRKSPSHQPPQSHLQNECITPTSPNDERRKSSKNRHRSQRRHRTAEDVRPGDSVSIVAIEQLLPKPHKCSKGENCPKWQKRQRKLTRLAKDLPIELHNGTSIISGDPGNAATAENLVHQPKSDATPSVVASSDVLGPQQAPEFKLSEEKLSEVQPRDPQENVRQFLNFQHMSTLKMPNDPPTPRVETFRSPDTPKSAKTNISLSENLAHLPKLTIPVEPAERSLSANQSALRTITPSILLGSNRTPTNRGPSSSIQDYNPYTYGQAISPADLYRQETPFSEMDVPATAIPLGPIERDASQSVPPDMRYGNQRIHPQVVEPIARPSSTKHERQRRRPSFQTLSRLDEDKALRPIETPEDLDATPRAPARHQPPSQGSRQRQNSTEEADDDSGSSTPTDSTHTGWMKKRKTTRLLRHEWQDHHFTLRGTQLAMYADEQASRRASKALEYIDVDDYAVACSSLASNSKLTAAFKKTVLKRRESATDQTAFGFSLIPGNGQNGSSSEKVDRRALFLSSSGKSHHFAVKTRDQRIDWMRELMLAKALKKGKEDGGVVRVNGNFI